MNDNLLVQFERVNATEHYNFGDTDVFETRFTSTGELYKYCLVEYGRCVSKVFVDTESGAKAVGWVFQKRVKYDDCKETYLQETWVTIHKSKPVKRIEYTYLGIG